MNPGFTNITHWLGPSDSNTDFNISDYTTRDNKVSIAKVGYSAELTKPPPYLSESELITLMEKHGIGTDASMATHINNIIQREYVNV